MRRITWVHQIGMIYRPVLAYSVCSADTVIRPRLSPNDWQPWFKEDQAFDCLYNFWKSHDCIQPLRSNNIAFKHWANDLKWLQQDICELLSHSSFERWQCVQNVEMDSSNFTTAQQRRHVDVTHFQFPLAAAKSEDCSSLLSRQRGSYRWSALAYVNISLLD